MEAASEQVTPKGTGVDVVNMLRAELENHYPAVWSGKQSIHHGVLNLVYSVAIERMKKEGVKPAEITREAVLKKISADIEVRAQKGLETYGERLTSHNGRDPELDLYQELLDAFNYSGQDWHEEKTR